MQGARFESGLDNSPMYCGRTPAPPRCAPPSRQPRCCAACEPPRAPPRHAPPALPGTMATSSRPTSPRTARTPSGRCACTLKPVDTAATLATAMGQGARHRPGQRAQPLRSHPPALQWPSEGCGSAPQAAYRYDVGFASMVAMEAEALAELAPLAGRAEAVARLRARAATQRGLIAAHLWDAQGGSIHASCMGCRVDVIAHPTPTLAPTQPQPEP